MSRPGWIRPFIVAMVMAMLSVSCASPGPELPDDLEVALAELETVTLEDARDQDEGFDELLDESEGYAVFTKRSTKIPVFGQAEGYGVAVDRRNGRRVPLRVRQFEAGGGLGDVSYRLLIVYTDRSEFERLKAGTMHFGAGAAAAGGEGVSATSAGDSRDRGWRTFLFADSGATATWTVRMIRFEPLEMDG